MNTLSSGKGNRTPGTGRLSSENDQLNQYHSFENRSVRVSGYRDQENLCFSAGLGASVAILLLPCKDQ